MTSWSQNSPCLLLAFHPLRISGTNASRALDSPQCRTGGLEPMHPVSRRAIDRLRIQAKFRHAFPTIGIRGVGILELRPRGRGQFNSTLDGYSTHSGLNGK